jgi:MFS family permease
MSDSGSLKRLWLAQFLSLFGTDVTKFALRVWTYASTGSSTQFALVTFFSEMPSILLSPFTGSLVDSVPRKQLMIMADAVAAAATFILFLLHSAGLLSVSHIYLANIVGSVCNSIQWPAFISTVSMMVEKKDLVKVNGWNQAANGMSMLLAPLLAGYLVNDLKPAGLRTVFFIEFLTFALACVITLGTAIPSASAETNEKAKEPSRPGSFISYLWQQTLSAWSFISARPGLLALLFLLSQTMFLSGMVQVLMTPLVLGFSTPLMLGNVLTFSGIGAMLGFALPALWGGPKVRKTWGVLGCVGVQGVLLAGVGLYRSVPWVLFISVSCGFRFR